MGSMSAVLRLVTLSSALVLAAGGAVAACASEQDGSQGNESAVTQPKTVDVQVLAINDFHGNLEAPTGSNGVVTAHADDPIASAGPDGGVIVDHDAGTAKVPTGGAAYLAAHIRQLRAQNPNTVVVSAGDLTGASPLLSRN